MSNATPGGGMVGATANALVLESLIEALRRGGVLDAAQIEAIYLAATDAAAKLPAGHVDPNKVRELIGALAARSRGRASLAPIRPRAGDAAAPEG